MSTSTTPLIDALAIAHLDFQPVCQIQFRQECENPADFLIVTHGCFVVEAKAGEWVDILVCKQHLDRCRKEYEYWVARQMIQCYYCNKVLSTYSDLVKTVVPL